MENKSNWTLFYRIIVVVLINVIVSLTILAAVKNEERVGGFMAFLLFNILSFAFDADEDRPNPILTIIHLLYVVLEVCVLIWA